MITVFDPQMLNHYSYVRNNPLVLVDPTGLYAMFVCGMNQDCEEGGIDVLEDWVRQYWRHKYGWDEETRNLRWKQLNDLMARGATAIATVWFFDVAFFDTEGVGDRAIMWGGDVIASVEKLNSLIARLDAIPGRGMDLMVGYSFGGVVAHDYVWGIIHGKIGNTSGDFDLVLLQPAFHVNDFPLNLLLDWPAERDERRWNDPRHVRGVKLPVFFDARHPELNAGDWKGGVIITVNGSPYIWGKVQGATNTDDPRACPGLLQHCTHQDMAEVVIPMLACCPAACVP
jgi:hypothetical protein